MDTAKIFWSGGSQAVRLPKAYRIRADRALIQRRGQAIVLEPIVDDWAWLDARIGPVDDDFVGAAAERQN